MRSKKQQNPSRKTRNRRVARPKLRMMSAAGWLTIQWQSTWPDRDDVLLNTFDEAVAETEVDTDEQSIERSKHATELRCIAMYGPVPVDSPLDLRRQFAELLAKICALMDGDDYFVMDVTYRYLVDDGLDEDWLPPAQLTGRRFECVLGTLDASITDIKIPIETRKQLEWVRALAITERARHIVSGTEVR